MEVRLSLIPSPLTQTLLDGAVAPLGWALRPEAARSVDGNTRRMLQGDFDLGEMSFATFLRAREDGQPLLGLPCFTGRSFLQGGMLRSAASPAGEPGRLAGRRIGVPQYWMTSSVWHRGILREVYGVAPEACEWVTTAPERLASLHLPAPGRTRQDASGRSLPELLQAGAIDFILAPPRPRGPGPVAPLFVDVADAERAYWRQTAVLPVMHFVVARRELAERDPAGLCAFCAGLRAAATAADPPGPLPSAYSLAANRRAVETFVGYALAEGLISRPPDIESLFFAGDRARDA